MPLLGEGAMLFWHDVVEEDADYNHWHAFEHMAERVGIPGFYRGRRYLASAGGPAYFNMYETENAATLTSAAYLERLNNPSPWTRRTLARYRNSNRTLSRVRTSAGTGLGGVLMSIQLAPAVGRAQVLDEGLRGIAMTLVRQPGIVAVHSLEADPDASRRETGEKSLRDGPDAVADWVLLVEALTQPALEALRAGPLSDAGLAALGAGVVQNVAIYKLLHVLSETELGDRADAPA